MPISNEWYQTVQKNYEQETEHRSIGDEYSFYNSVKAGDMAAIIKNCENHAFTDLNGVGVLSKNDLRNLKYHFVVTAALLTRYCVEGGLETEQAYRLSDFYILKMDGCSTIKQVADLHDVMVKDFTGKMMVLKKKDIISKPVIQCVDYIYTHLKDRITIQTLSEHTGLSPSYLSRVFKANQGISISDYIRELKIQSAIHLLKFSDTPVIDIANYLSFSSQSHFIQTFEKHTGLTPKKYRDRYCKSMW